MHAWFEKGSVDIQQPLKFRLYLLENNSQSPLI